MAVIRNLQVADPGVGFDLDLSQELSSGKTLPNLAVSVSIYNTQIVSAPTYSSSVALNSTIATVNNNSTLVFVVPFGDNAYQANQILNVTITVSSNGNVLSGGTLSNNCTAQSGVFSYSVGTALRILARALGLL